MKPPPRARSPTVLRILLHSGFGAEKQHKENFKRFPRRDRMRSATVVVHLGLPWTSRHLTDTPDVRP